MKLLNYRMHFVYSLQTHSGGASSSKTNCNYSEKQPIFLATISRLPWLLCR
jgi:hypothetical protein